MNQKVVDALNQGRQRELLAVSQYMVQHYELEDQMYGKLASRFKKIGIQEMRHAEDFAERVLFLGGVPADKPDVPAKKGQAIREMLQTGIALEKEAIKMYNDAAKLCSDEGDHVSKQLFERLAQDEEALLDEFQNTLDFVDNLGGNDLATLVSAEGD